MTNDDDDRPRLGTRLLSVSRVEAMFGATLCELEARNFPIPTIETADGREWWSPRDLASWAIGQETRRKNARANALTRADDDAERIASAERAKARASADATARRLQELRAGRLKELHRRDHGAKVRPALAYTSADLTDADLKSLGITLPEESDHEFQ